MAAIGDWKKEIADNVCKADAAKYAGAIETLMSWPMFKSEFDWTGMKWLTVWLNEKATRSREEFTAMAKEN